MSETVRARAWRGPEAPSRILAIRLHAFGDTIITLPYLAAVRRRFPDASIDFLTREEVAEIPRAVDLFDRVIAIGGGRDFRRIALAALAAVPGLIARRYQVVLDLQRSRISRMVRHLLLPAAWSEFDRLSPALAGERTRATIEAAGLGPLEVRSDLRLRRADAGVAPLRAAGWDGADPIVVLNPAGAFSGRSWPIAAYARFAGLWIERVAPRARFALVGLPALESKARALRGHLGDRVLDLVGRTDAAEAFDVVRRASLVLSEDSGLMHVAWVAGAPTLGLFGASRGTWARPHGNAADWIRGCERSDGDCLDGVCRGANGPCLARTTPEEVVERARALVERAAGAPRLIYAAGREWSPAPG